MKSITFKFKRREVRAHALAPTMIEILQLLASGKPLTRAEMLIRIADKTRFGNAMTKLLELRCVAHPTGEGGHWRYEIVGTPRIAI